MILPKLRMLRDTNPITGQVWVVDENNHCVAQFRIKKPECHIANATSDIMDASLNHEMAEALIINLHSLWTLKQNVR